MTASSTLARGGCAALALLALLAACDRPKPGTSPAAPPPAVTGAPPPPPAIKTSQDPLPALPAWAAPMIGKTLKDVLPDLGGTCIGNTDVVDMRYVGASQGVQIEGWGWDSAAKQVVARVVVVDIDGKIVGAGETGVPRPDVQAARGAEVTSPTSGWKAIVNLTTGSVDAYGVVGDGSKGCKLGHLVL
jgi:hypothetical protein